MSEKVLLVDDVSMFLDLQKGYLQLSAVEILCAANGAEALKMCRRERPSLVFMDLNMPVMNGAECCEAIKKDPLLRSIPVVLIASEGREAERKLCLAAGCDDFITKPLDRKIFLETARRLFPVIDRRDKRVYCHIKTTFRASGTTGTGYIVSLSRQGVFLATSYRAAPGESVELMFSLPDPIQYLVQLKGEVVWTNESGEKERQRPDLPDGFGIRFLTVPEETEKNLTRFVETQSVFTSPTWTAA